MIRNPRITNGRGACGRHGYLSGGPHDTVAVARWTGRGTGGFAGWTMAPLACKTDVAVHVPLNFRYSILPAARCHAPYRRPMCCPCGLAGNDEKCFFLRHRGSQAWHQLRGVGREIELAMPGRDWPRRDERSHARWVRVALGTLVSETRQLEPSESASPYRDGWSWRD